MYSFSLFILLSCSSPPPTIAVKTSFVFSLPFQLTWWKLCEVPYLPCVHTCVPRTELFVDIHSICGLKEKSHTSSAQITKETCLVVKRNVATQNFSVLFDCDLDTAEHCLVTDQEGSWGTFLLCLLLVAYLFLLIHIVVRDQ